jgi:putative MATE family efflux protein
MITATPKNIDMTSGRPWKVLLAFSLPLLWGSLLQQLYNTVDTWMVGVFVGESALSAVGTCGVLTNLCVAFSTGFSVGAGVISSQLFGAGREKDLTQNAYSTLHCMAWMGIIMTAFGLLAGPFMLKWLVAVPESLLKDANAYFSICTVGFVFQFGYNAIAALLRSVGDSKASLYFLLISSIVNIALDYVLVAIIPLGVMGTAIATVFSQLLSCIISFVYMQKKYQYFRFAGKGLKVRRAEIHRIIKTGMPMALQSMVGMIFNLLMQRLVNSYGEAMTASYTVVTRVEGYMHLPAQTLTQGMATYSAQNTGAARPERIEKGLKQSIAMSFFITLPLSLFSFFFAEQIAHFFGIGGASAAYCIRHMQTLSFGFLLFAIYYPCMGLYQGVGNGYMSTVSSTTFLLISLSLGYGLQHIPAIGYTSIFISKPVAWLLMVPFNYIYYAKGSWKRSELALIGRAG